MIKNKPFERTNQSKILFLLALLAMFLVMLFCNLKTNLLADDFMYCFNFADGSRITGIAQIFPSMWAHRYSMNGRLVSHALVQLFLLLPSPIFKILNSLVFVAEVYLIYRIANGRKSLNLLLLCCVFGSIWAFTLNFGQVALWLTGSVNYLWATFFTLLFLYIYIRKFMYDKDIKSLPLRILFVIAGFFVGAYSENCASTMIFCTVCFMLLSHFLKKQKLHPYMWLAVVTALAGFFFMLSAPAEIANKSSQLTFTNLFDNFVTALSMYSRICIPFIVYLVLAVIAYNRKLDRDTQLLAFVLMLGSLAAVFVLTFASFFPERSAYIGTLMIIAAAAVLFAELFNSDLKPLIVSLGLICLLVAFYRGAIGVQDIIKTNYYLTENENQIIACREEGIMDVTVYRVYSETGYCAIDGIAYLNTEEANTWPNIYMAEYFGIDSIIGG
jgi:hypothetical protein